MGLAMRVTGISEIAEYIGQHAELSNPRCYPPERGAACALFVKEPG